LRLCDIIIFSQHEKYLVIENTTKMAYIECKIWYFHVDDDYSQKCRCKTIESLWDSPQDSHRSCDFLDLPKRNRSSHKDWKEHSSEGRKYHTVKALIDTSSSENFISENLANKLGEKYGEHYKNEKVENSLGTIICLELSLLYNGKDRLVSGSNEYFNDFEVIKKPTCKGTKSKEQADLILGIPWLWLREAKIDMEKKGITIYGNFIPFCKGPGKDNSFYNSSGEPESNSSDESINEIVERYQPKKRKTRRKYKVFSIQSNPMIRRSQK
jgi:hypothetical protein